MSEELEQLAASIVDGVNAAFASRTPEGDKVPYLKDSAKSKIEAAIRLFVEEREQQQAARISELERKVENLVDERDEAMEFGSQAYYLIVGESPEWSNLRGYELATEEIDEAQTLLRNHAKAQAARIEELEAQFEQARQWNKLVELELQNLRGISTDDERDISVLKTQLRLCEEHAATMAKDFDASLDVVRNDHDRYKAEAERLKIGLTDCEGELSTVEEVNDSLRAEVATLRPKAELATKLAEAKTIGEYQDARSEFRALEAKP